jgi:uncharacterized membrane protein
MNNSTRFTSSHAVCIVVLSGLVVVSGCSKKLAQYQDAPVHDNKIIILLRDVRDGKAHFFMYTRGGRQINFFVRTDAQGTVSSYFDACYTCYKQKKGYRQEGPDLICNECGMKFGLSDETWEAKGGCDPILLKSAIEGDNLIIETAVIEKGMKLFH